MKYTIIIPVYNGSATLHKCLLAITSQKNTILNEDYTVIVVDDGSTDNTIEIASKFPVSIIRLGCNKGRIIARLAGAKTAQTEKLLFVDSRVILPRETIKNLDNYKKYRAVMGSCQGRELKYRSMPDTIFYLIRRRYYGKGVYPQQIDLLEINRDNFKRSPKGTTVLLIDKSIYLKLIPERIDKTVNDDTLLFQNLIFKNNISLFRSKKLPFKYIQRSDMKSFIPWLFERGIRFADYYLRPSGYYFTPFLITFFSLASILIYALITVNTLLLFYLLFFLILLILMTSIYLSENVKDFFVSITMLPFISIIFGAGVIKYISSHIKKYIPNLSSCYKIFTK